MSYSILLIEDNNEMRENIAEILELANYKVHTASNGKEGLKKAKSLLPNLIVSDIMMPVMDGYEVLYLLGKYEKTKKIPFIFLTAKSEPSDFRKGMNLGADDYLVKPFEEMDLLNVVETRINRSKLLSQEFSKDRNGLMKFIDTSKGIEELTLHAKTGKPKEYKKKEIIFHEEDPANYLYFLERGKVRLFKKNESGKEFTIGLSKPGDFIGYMPLLKNCNHTDSAVAMEDITVFRIHKEDFNKLMYKNQEITYAFIKILSGSLITKEEEILNLAYNSVRKRMADGLLLLHKRYQRDEEDRFSIAIPREDLASMAGTSSESAIRALSAFKEEKLIQIKGSEITILDLEGLVNTAQ